MVRERSALPAAFALIAITTAPALIEAQVQTLVIGRSGTAWSDLAERVVGLEDTTSSGALQPWQLPANTNLLVGPRTEAKDFTNIFGTPWSLKKVFREGFELGINPRFWGGISGTVAGGPSALVDNNPDTVIKVINVFEGSNCRECHFTFDFAFPLPINRVVFFPPDRGVDELGGLKKQRFPQAYEISATLEPEDFLLLNQEKSYHTLESVLARTFFNSDRVVDVSFPTELFRFLRISFNLRSQLYLLGEIQVYGEGYVPETTYRSVVIPMGERVNFGRIFWKFETFRRTETGVVPDPEAPVELTLETRSGSDPTPKTFRIWTEFETEREVDEATYDAAPEASIRLGDRPGDKASIGIDEEHWSFWSTPYSRPGQDIRSPDGREFLQLRFKMTSEDFNTFGRIDSVGVEFSPLLVEELVGEVGLMGEGLGTAGPPEIPAGVDTIFIYDVLARFGPNGSTGFDGLRLAITGDMELLKMEVGEPLVEIIPDSSISSGGELVLFFPSNRIGGVSGSERLRLTLRATVFNFRTDFNGEVFELEGENLPQSIEPGDAGPMLESDDVVVFAVGKGLSVLSQVALSSPVVTPNGDGVNDELIIDFTVLAAESTECRIGIYALDGSLVQRLVRDDRGRGAYHVSWDGRDGQGVSMAPGVYLVRLSIETDQGESQRVLPVAVAY